MRKPNGNLALAGYNDIFNVGMGGDAITEIPLDELHEPDNHPFQVNNDDAMTALVDSIRQHGVREPGLARQRAEGGYELLCGNRRKMACQLAGLATLPVIIRELSDDDAAIAMVDSNPQRINPWCYSTFSKSTLAFDAYLTHNATKQGEICRRATHYRANAKRAGQCPPAPLSP